MTDPELRWGVLGSTAHISTRVAPAIHRTPGNTVTAVAARPGRTEASGRFAEPFGARVHDGFESLLADDEVDAVYIALPNSLHVPWTLRALAAGKHVLCEKPMALSEADCVRIEQASAGLTVAEAYMYRFHPQQRRVVELLASGEIGDLRVVRAAFAGRTDSVDDIRYDPALGGGATWDVGCYAFDTALWAFGRAPEKVRAWFHHENGAMVDTSAVATLDFGDGRAALIDYSFDYGPRSRYELQGTRGSIEVRNAWATENDECLITVVTGDGSREEVLPAADPYEHQTIAFHEAVRTGSSPLVTLADSKRTARVGEALVESARTDTEVTL
ncbi:putative dehydrogenase [Saccharothrix tamanrassetensis]|uniref:Putative dehydrogenase n=1 Tax=Saccharothrix tamanrassetensis TaxID=1051531 RepID=A0A841CCG7_9PSEU|nr:Gfo/Idh/MocA family oxidoreductase [Saccharothrix tamanrassetensis]MBB5954054.1 putative dehydrogenase [Saccharothrix tamanrassetensis]